jgi:hypothetical protein
MRPAPNMDELIAALESFGRARRRCRRRRRARLDHCRNDLSARG